MPHPFRVLLAPDSFKGSLSAIQFCEIATQVIQSIQPNATVISRPMSDGGEGFVDSFVFAGLAEKQRFGLQMPWGVKPSGLCLAS